ncbi:Talin [Entamoeba marina]
MFGNERQLLSTKKMSFSFSATIYDILISIRDKQPNELNLEEYALFYPDDSSFGKGKWLIPQRTIESYDLVTDCKLWFRRRMQVVRVLLPDGSTKKMMLDVCQNVKGIIYAIADKLSLNHPEAFGLIVSGTNKFLRMKASLYEVMDPDDVVTIKKRHYIQEGELNKEDPMLLHLSYIQAHDSVANGHYPCTKDEIIRFGSLNAMIDIGKWDETKKQSSIKHKINQFIPEKWQKKEIEKEIFAKWKSMNAMTPIDAKYKYLQLCMTLRSYGMNIYHGGVEPKGVPHQSDPKKRKLIPVIMAFSPAELKMMTPDHKIIVCEPYEHLRNWKYTAESILFDFAKYNNGEVINFFTSEGEDIYSLVLGYNEIIALKATKTSDNDKDVENATEVLLTKKKKTAAVKSTTVKTRIVAQPAIAQTATISGEANAYQANKNYALPINFAVDIKERTTANDGDWRNQLRSQSDNLLSLLKPLSETILNGALSCEDKDVLEAMSNNLMDAIRDFMDCCSAVDADPNNSTLIRAMDEAEKRVLMCIEALNATANGLTMEIDQDVLYELAQSISADVDHACDVARENNTAIDDKITSAQDSARMLLYGAQSMGLAMGNPECAKMMKDLLSGCQNTAVELLASSQMKGTEKGKELELDVAEIEKETKLGELFVDDIANDLASKRKHFLESAASCLQVSDWLSGLENLRVEDLKKGLPVMVKYLKEYTAQPEIDDARRAFVISNLKDMTSNAKVILSNADQNVYSPSNNDSIRDSAGDCADSIRAVLGEELSDVVHHAMYTDSKKAALASLRNNNNRELLLKAARATAEAMQKLLQPVEDDNERQFVLNSLGVTSDYKKLSAVLDGVANRISDGRSDLVEDKSHLDVMMDKLEQDVNTFQREDMLNSLHAASMDYRLAAAELKHEMLIVESAAELEESGIKEECNEDALKALEEFEKVRHQLDSVKPFDYSTPNKVSDVSTKSKNVLKALVKASKTSKKKNERKMLLDAAMKLSNEMSRLLSAVDDESIGGNSDMKLIDKDILADVRQLTNILKVDDIVDLQTSAVTEVTSEELAMEKAAEEKIKTTTAELGEIQKRNKKEAEASGDPKKIVGAALQEAVVVMIGSSVGVLSSASQAQSELVTLLQNPSTAPGVHRDIEYAEDLIKAVEEVRENAIDLQQKVKDDNVTSDELVKAADKVGKKVERVVVSCRAGTKTKGKSNKYKELLNASRKLADATKNLLECAKKVDEFDDTPVVVAAVSLPPPPPAPVVIEEEEDDVETFGIDAYTLREIEQQKKIFELEKKLEAAKKKKRDLEEFAKTFENK